jgi:Zn-dependent peptidase ImmA (M78 family)
MEFEQITKIVKEIHSKISIDYSNFIPLKVISKTNNDLKTHIAQYVETNTGYKIDISIEDLDFLNQNVYGIYKKFKVNLNTYRVKILLNNNRGNSCWERFVATKELSHILLDDNNNTWTNDILTLISELLDDETPFLKSEIAPDVQTEYTSIIFAMELLVPFEYNNVLLDTTKTSKEIASVFMIPEKFIDIMKKPDYQKSRITAYN